MVTQQEMTARELTDSELANVPPIQVSSGHERNPFHAVTDHPVGLANAKAWTRVHGWDALAETGAREHVANDALDALGDLLAVDSVGWHRAEGPQGVALFPHTAQDIGDWEARCIDMHEAQNPITVEPKPVQDYADFVRLNRGD